MKRCWVINRPIIIVIKVLLEYFVSLLLYYLYPLSFFLLFDFPFSLFFLLLTDFFLSKPLALSSEIMHVFIFQAYVFATSETFLGLRATIVRMFVPIFKLNDLLTELARLWPERTTR